MESPNAQHQGELSLLEMIQTMKSPSADVTLSSAAYAMELNEERLRRSECEKQIRQLQCQVSALQLDYAVSQETIKRKDALLMQAHQEWRTSEVNWKQKLANIEISKESLESEIVCLKTQIQSVTEEKQLALLEMKNICQINEEAKIDSLKLKDLNEQYLNQIRAANIRCDEYSKEIQRFEKKVEDVKRDYNRMMGQIEDLKRDKSNSDVELELLQERYESSRHQWELHCQNRIEETKQLADQESERRLQRWQKEVETKVRHAVSSLEQQLRLLKDKNMEETRLMVARHEAEVKELRERCSSLQNKIQRRHREYEQLTQNMKQLLEAQGNSPIRNKGYSDQDSIVSDISSAVCSSMITKHDEMQEYVNQVIKRHSAKPS